MMNPTLAELILDTKDRNEYSYESLAKACGGVPGAGRLHQLATKEQKTFPDPETINGLARGCKVAPLEVIKAASRSLGLSVADDAADSVRIHGYDQLPGKLKTTIQDLGEQVAELARKAGDGSEHSATPMNRAEGNSAERQLGTTLADNENRQRSKSRLVPDLDAMAAYDTGNETEKQRLDRESRERGEGPQ